MSGNKIDGGSRTEDEEKVHSWLYALAQSEKDLVFEHVHPLRGLAYMAETSIYTRFIALCGGEPGVVPEAVLSLIPQQLRQIGFRVGKVATSMNLQEITKMRYFLMLLWMIIRFLQSLTNVNYGLNISMEFWLIQNIMLCNFFFSWRFWVMGQPKPHNIGSNTA